MAINYEVRLYTPDGQFVASITDLIDSDGSGLEYVLRSDGGIGALKFTVPTGTLDKYLNWQNVDYKIGVWRSINGAPYYLDNDAMFFIRGFQYFPTYTTVTAYHALELFTRRLNAYRKETFNNFGPQQLSWGGRAVETESFRVTYAGNLMKGIVRQNYSYEYAQADRFGIFDTAQRWNRKLSGKALGSGANKTSWNVDLQIQNLDMSDYIEIEPEKNDGIDTAGIDCNGGVVYKLLQQLQSLSLQGDEEDNRQPIYITFDLKSINERKFIFRTYQNLYGKNRGNGNFIFSMSRGNLAEPSMTVDRAEESTVMYSMDKDENIKAAVNRRRLNDSPFNLREALSQPQIKENYYTNPKSVGNVTSVQLLRNDAFLELRKKTARVKIEGTALPTPDSIRGIHWDVGDIVTLEFRGYRDDYRITAVQVNIEGGVITEDVQWEQVDLFGFGGDTSDEISY
jgi:hypothetical protein